MMLDELNSSQKAAVTFNGKHLLVLAGAGTGKTKTIIARAAYLISQGVSPSKIQILTFTKRSASEIVNRVKATLETNQANTLKGSTFHSWCNHLLTKFPNLFGTTSFTVIDDDDQLSIMKMVCGKNMLEFEDIRIKPQALLDLYSYGRNTKRNLTNSIRAKLFPNMPEREFEQKIKAIKPQIEVLLKGYEQKKRERKYLDYDDILSIVATRLRNDPEARRIISAQYEHILVDEMQDTNPLQWDLLEPFQTICHLFCVGDDAQSIYSFRGADFKNVHSFKERVADSEVYRLEDNYRSTQEILDLSNWLLESSPIEYNKKLRAVRGNGLVPQILNVANEWDEANHIADKIIENYTHNGKTYIDHLILSRSQFYTKNLQAVFIQKKIPYVTYGGRKFMESAHIKDLIAALRVVNNTNDEIAWMRFLTFWEGIGEMRATKFIGDLLALQTIEKCIEWLEGLKLDDKARITPVLKAILNNRGNVQLAVGKAYLEMQNQLAKKYREDWDSKRKSDFPVLEILANNYGTLGEFISESVLDNSINHAPTLADSELHRSESKDHVIISTVHSAKGLEADTCFVLNVSPKVYPSSWSLGNTDEMEEDRRVLYVALTRAKNELIVTRNISSIHAADNAKLVPSENAGLLQEAGINPYYKLVQEHYFLNGLPEELGEQSTIGSRANEARDIPTANSLDLYSGMDFS